MSVIVVIIERIPGHCANTRVSCTVVIISLSY